jgi:uncharacterized membrane protein
MSVEAPPSPRPVASLPAVWAVARVDRPLAAVALLAAAYAGVFSWLSIARYHAFWQARFDLGNMVQAVWSAAHGHLFITTDLQGEQISRLSSHVDPILGALAPLWWIWPSPVMLLVVQAVVVATGAFPAFLLGRRWLGDDRLAVAFGAVYLLYPPLQWATVTEFHAVTLAAPLLLWCIWAADAGRMVTLGVLATAAALCKEEVGLSLAILGLWMAVSLHRRRAGAVLAACSLAWTAIAIWVVIPHFNHGQGSVHVAGRYGELGSDAGGVIRTLVTEPWRAADIIATEGRGRYVLALLLPLAFLSLFAPLLAAGALPELLLNLLSSRTAQHEITYHYASVIVPFLVAAAILGLSRLRRLNRPRALTEITDRPALLATLLVVWMVVAGIHLGPLPFWRHVPQGSDLRTGEYTAGAHAAALSKAVALVPDDAVVSAGNRIGGHLSARRRILTFPVVADAEYVLVDRTRPDLADTIGPVEHERLVRAILARPDMRLIYERDGVLVIHRVTPARS